MERDAAEEETPRRLRVIGARLCSLPDGDELLSLLQEASTLLYKVDQNELDSMHSALFPVMSALIKTEILEHTDPGVKLAVASCLTALTKIRAPDPPYDDDVMKGVLKLVVEAFCELDDVDCPSYGTRVSMLRTFAEIRGCALLLDLNCNDLIRDMFHHFFRIIPNVHQKNVTSYMESVMKSVIEETTEMERDLIQDLATCLLQNVKKGKKESLPESYLLAEKIIGQCHEKLKPVFIKLLQGTPINEYTNLVTSLFQDATDAGDNNVDAFMHGMKEVVSTKSSTMVGKTKRQLADSREELKRKHVQETKEAPKSNKKGLADSVVGSRIKVWSPADKMFYNRFDKSSDASLKTQQVNIFYRDLLRSNEKYLEVQDYNPDASPDMAQDRSDKASFGQPFQGTHKVANKHSSVIQEKYNTVQNKTQSISTETNITLPVRMSGWENCHLEPEKVSVVFAGKPPPLPQHIASLQKNLTPSPTHKKQAYKPQARSTQCKLTPSSAH